MAGILQNYSEFSTMSPFNKEVSNQLRMYVVCDDDGKMKLMITAFKQFHNACFQPFGEGVYEVSDDDEEFAGSFLKGTIINTGTFRSSSIGPINIDSIVCDFTDI